MSIQISMAEAQRMVLDNMRQRQIAASRAGRQVRTFWGYWNNQPVYLTIGEAISEVESGSELGKFILTVELQGIAQQTGQTYELV